MDWDDYQRLSTEGLSGGDDPAEVAGELLADEERALLPVGRSLSLPADAVCTAAFGPGGRTLHATALRAGVLLVGAVPGGGVELDPVRLQLGGFDRRPDEVLGVFTSRQPLSPLTDIHVVVRRWAPGSDDAVPRLHRATARIQGDQVQVGRGGAGLRTRGEGWRPMDLAAEELPPWLAVCHVAVPPGVELLATQPPHPDRWQAPGEDPAGVPHTTLCAAWDGRTLVRGTEEDALLLPGRKGARLWATPQVLAPAPADEGRLRVVVACREGALCGLVVDLAGLPVVGPDEVATCNAAGGCVVESADRLRCGVDGLGWCGWRHRQESNTVALATLPGPEHAGWPDVLQVTDQRVLRRLRHVPAGAFDSLLDAAIGELRRRERLETLEDWCAWARRVAGHRVSSKHVCTVAHLLLRRAAQEEEPSQETIGRIGRLLRERAFQRGWSRLGEVLVRLLRCWSCGDEGRSRTPALVRAVYGRTGFEVQERVDQEILDLEPAGDLEDDTDFQALARLATDSYWDLLAKREDDASVARTALGVAADFAAEPFALEAFHSLKTESVAGALPVRRGTGWRVRAFRRVAVRELALDGSRLEPSGAPLYFPGFPRLLHVTPVWLGPDDPAALVGARGGRAYLLADDWSWADIRGPAGTTCPATLRLDPSTGDGAVRVGLVWSQQRRSFLEVLDLRRGSDRASPPEIERRLFQPLPALGAPSAAAALRQGSDDYLLAVGFAGMAEVVLFHVDLAAKTVRREEEFPLDASAGALHFAGDGDGACLLAGSGRGLLWRLRVKDLRVEWIFQVRHRVRDLDVLPGSGPGDELIAAVADPEDVLLLDGLGRRVWRRRLGRRLRSVRAFPEVPGEPERFLVSGRDGYLAVFRRPDRTTDWDEEAARRLRGLAPADTGPAGELAGVLTAEALRDPAATMARLVQRKSRRVFVSRVVRRSLDADQRQALAAEATHREFAAMLAALPEDQRGWADVLFDAALARDEGVGDDSPRARRAAITLALRRLGEEAPGTAELEERIRRVPEDCLDDQWLRIEGARVWAVLAERQGSDDLLGLVDPLPPPLVEALGLVVRPAEEAAGLATLGRLGREVARGRELSSSEWADLAAALGSNPSRLGRLLGHMARTAAIGPGEPDEHDARWRALGSVFEEARQVEVEGPGVFRKLAAILAERAAQGFPAETWDLRRQSKWLRDALERPMHLAGSADDSPWSRLGQALAKRFDDTFRELARRRLAWAEGLTRMRLHFEQVARSPAGHLHLDLALVPEGRQRLYHANVLVRPEGRELRAVEEPLERSFTRQVLCEGEPSERFRMVATYELDLDEVSVHVEVTSENQPPYVCTWSHGVPTTGPEEGLRVVPGPDDVPELLAAVRERLASVAGGSVVVVADPVFDWDALVEALLEGGEAHVVNLDGAFSATSARPDSRQLLAALSGVEIEDLDGTQEARLDGRGASRLIVRPCHRTVGRLLESERPGARDSVLGGLADHQRSLGSPALLWLLPTPLAGRFRRLLGDGVPMVLPGRLDRVPPAAVDEVVAWLAGAAGVAPKAARRLLREAGSDLRVLAAALERCVGQRAPDVREDELRAVAQHDLEALGARHAISLMAVAGATHQLPLKSLRAGLVAAEDLDAPQAGGGTIRLVQAGDTLDEKTVRAIRRELGGRSRVLMRGTPIRGRLSLQPGRAALREFVGNLEEVCRHLETAGLGHIQAGFLHVAPLYEEAVVQAIGDADTLQEAFAALRRGATLLDGIVLERLHNVTRADARVLTGDRHTDLELLRLVGETWRDVRRNAAPVQPTCRSLAERLSGQAAVVLSPEEGSPHLSLFRELPAGRARLLGLGEPDGRGAYGAYLAVCNVTDRPPEGLASLLGKVLAGEADARPALVLLGPGVDLWPSQEQGPGVAVLDELDLKRILQAPSVEEAFWRTVRAHTGLRALSPFRHVGALPEGSPMFVGRRELLERIARELAQRSFLVVGSRQIGKTSLINQLLHEAKLREDVRLVYLDTQGIRSGGELQHRLLEHVPAARREALAALPPIEVMRSLARSAREEGRTAVFLLNEADGIAYRDRPLMQGMRGMHDEGLARFLLVGHTTIVHELRRPASPLFHMTEGRAGEAAVNLGELESEAALELIDKLEERPLGLGWVNEHERKEGRRLLLRRTYRIPWVIQDTCGRLVRLLDGERRGELRLDDVRRVTEQVQPLLEHLHDTEFDTILGRGHEGLADDAVRAVLSALTHRRYCTRGRFSDQSDPGDEPPTEQHAFTSSQALEIMLEEVEARYQPRASALLSDYLRHFPYERLLRGLSLTLIISPLPDQSMGGKPRYCFQNHIYPEELRLAQRRKDRTPLDRLASALEGLRTRLGR